MPSKKKVSKVTEVSEVPKGQVQTRPQVLKGLVVAAKLAKSVTVVVERQVMHPLYQKTTLRSKRYLVHDELGVKEGDLVEIIGVKPMSANKFFKVSKVVGRDLATIIAEDLKEDVAEAIAEVMPEESEKLEVKSEKMEEQTKEVKKPRKPRKEQKNGTA